MFTDPTRVKRFQFHTWETTVNFNLALLYPSQKCNAFILKKWKRSTVSHSMYLIQKIGQELQTSGIRTDQVKVVNINRNTMGNFIGYSPSAATCEAYGGKLASLALTTPPPPLASLRPLVRPRPRWPRRSQRPA